VLNEVLASSATSDDWVELYNPWDNEISLVGYELRDDNNFWTFDKGTIPAGGFLQVICDGSGKNGKASFKLDTKGEQVSVHAANGDQLDLVAFPALTRDTSWGRIPDGEGTWTRLGTPTPGKPNTAGAPADGGVPTPDVNVQQDKGPTPDTGKKLDTGNPMIDYGKKLDFNKNIDYGKKLDFNAPKPDSAAKPDA
jgi:hypothetical protein